MVEYLIAVVTIAAAITLVWSVADRRRTEYTRLERWLRVYSRHALALVAMVYAFAPGSKVKREGLLRATSRFQRSRSAIVAPSTATVTVFLVEGQPR